MPSFKSLVNTMCLGAVILAGTVSADKGDFVTVTRSLTGPPSKTIEARDDPTCTDNGIVWDCGTAPGDQFMGLAPFTGLPTDITGACGHSSVYSGISLQTMQYISEDACNDMVKMTFNTTVHSYWKSFTTLDGEYDVSVYVYMDFGEVPVWWDTTYARVFKDVGQCQSGLLGPFDNTILGTGTCYQEGDTLLSGGTVKGHFVGSEDVTVTWTTLAMGSAGSKVKVKGALEST